VAGATELLEWDFFPFSPGPSLSVILSCVTGTGEEMGRLWNMRGRRKPLTLAKRQI
jgi:hypothetical protein